jgi:hypothetical protein
MRTNSWFRNATTFLTMVVSLALFGAVGLKAQTTQASISGVVSDASGAVVPGVTIKVTDKNRGVSHQGQTNRTGLYVITNLIPSTYQVTAEKSGFETFVVDSFPLTALQEAVLNITLRVGSVSQKVEVSSEVQMVDPSNATLTGVMNSTEIVDLPLTGRNPLNLALSEPGVVHSLPDKPNTTSFTSGARYQIGGGLESTSDFQLDGITIFKPSNAPGIYEVSAIPSVDSLAEMRVQTNDFSATNGASGGGIVSFTTKSGTNAFHGTAYEFLKNDVLSAATFFNDKAHAKKGFSRYDDYGGSLGGPVIKDRTFFFAAYERNLSHGSSTGTYSEPTAAMRQGDFSGLYNSSGKQIVIYNPFTTQPDPNNPGNYIRTAFSGNVIPTNMINSLATKVIPYLPMPNQPGTAVSGTSPTIYRPVNNVFLQALNNSPQSMFDTRVDHNFSSTKRAFIRYAYFNTVQGDANLWDSPAEPTTGALVAISHNAVLGYTQTFGSSSVLDLHAGINRFTALRPGWGYGFDVTQAGLPASVQTYLAEGGVPQFPILSMQNYNGTGFNAYYQNATTEWIESGDYSRVIGRHTLKIGGMERSPFLNFFQPSAFSASFNNDFTQGPNPRTASSAAGDGFASFLLGTSDGGSASYNPKTANANRYFAEYVTDTFKWTRKFTVNLGFRLEEETATTERFNRMVSIDPTIVNPISQQLTNPATGQKPWNQYGVYLFPGTGPGTLGGRAIGPVELKPNPRLGIAYMLNDKTVLRAGYGVFYGLSGAAPNNTFTSGAFSSTTSYIASLDGITPLNLVSNPFPQGYVYPLGSSPGELSGILQTGSLAGPWPNSLKTPYNQQWNFTVQRSLTPNTMLQVAYAGSKGTHLLMYGATIDQLPNQYESMGNSLLTLVPNPFYGVITAGLFAQKTIQEAYLLRPYTAWGGAAVSSAPWGNSWYESLQTSLQKRLSAGTTFTLGYTWSKTETDVSDGFWAGGTVNIRNNYCLSCEKAVSSYDQPSRLIFAYDAELPFGTGKRFGSSWGSTWHGVPNQILGGWQLSGILELSSGMPIAITSSQNTSYSFGGGQHPNLVGNPVLGSGQSLAEWFNPKAFQLAANFTFGDAARTMTAVRQAYTRNLDFSVFKNFRVTERFKLQFRSEAFNLTNTPIFAAPNGTIGSSAAGIVSSQANFSRQFQLAVKLIF